MDKVVVILDSGHGKDTPGKRSPDGVIREWKYTKELAMAISQKLRSNGVLAFVNNPEDEDVPLKERVDRVNDYARTNKVILVSIHLNAAGDGLQWKSASGWECYTCKGQTESDKLAECLCNAAREKLKDKQLRTDNSDGDSDKEADFYLLKHTKCPAVLTENLFMDNKKDYEYLLGEKGFNSIVDLHVLGIIKYLSRHE